MCSCYVLVRTHNVGCASPNRVCEWPKVQLVHGPVVEVGGHGGCSRCLATHCAQAVCLLFVCEEVLRRGHHSSVLRPEHGLMDKLSTEIWVGRESCTKRDVQPLFQITAGGRARCGAWFLTLPIPTALYHTSNRTNNRTQKDVDPLCPGLEPHVPCSVVCQRLVPTRSDMDATRECAHVVGSTNTVSGIVQTQPGEAHPGYATDDAGAPLGGGRARCQVDLLL
jgi:hypothetical protein